MAPRRVPKKKIDELVLLHDQIAELEAAYQKELLRLKAGGPAVYQGNEGRLILTECERATVDLPALIKEFKIPPKAVKKHTRETTYLRADVTHLRTH